MEDKHHNLLIEPLIRVELSDGGTALSLPAIMASLSSGDEIKAFSGLQPHQWPAWYAFLVQIAALSVLASGEDWRTLDEEGWRAQLRTLTHAFAEDEPWCLVVKDIARPAFMQTPVPEETLKGFEGPLATPDASDLDVLVTGKMHDLKPGRQVQTTLDTWIYSLAMLQTQSGYSGRGNYGIIRMNSGYGSRPLVGLAPGRPWGARFRRDLAVLLKEHEKLVHAHDRPRTGARALLWLEPWDGKTPIGLSECDPYVIEMARLIRLVEEAGSLVAYRKATQGQRLSPKVDVLKGNVGDPWIPVKSEGSALNIGPGGITYDRVRALLFQDGYRWSACQHPQPDDPPSVFFCAAAIARGQGGTEGFHERWIEIPQKRRWVLFDEHRRKTLGETARERVEQTANVRRRALHPALLVLLEGAPERRLNLKSNLDLRWLNVFEAKIDQRFFPNLWEDAELEGDEQKRRWARTLRGAAEEVLKLAEKEAPLADARRERALARAWMILRGGLKKWVPEAFESLEEAKNESAA